MVALSATVALGLTFVLTAALWYTVPTTTLPPPLVDHHQDAENYAYILTFALLLPAAIFVGHRVSARIEQVGLPGALRTVASLGVVGTGAAVGLSRLAVEFDWGNGTAFVGLTSGAVLCVFAAILWRASRSEWPALAVVGRLDRALWLVAAGLLGCVVLSVTELSSVSRAVLGVGGIVTLSAVVILGRVRLSRPSPTLGRFGDGLVVALLVFAVPNLVGVGLTGEPSASFKNGVMVFHQNFYLGPANQILGGDAMLVDVLSQYGVGSIYFLAGAFLVLPINNGSLGVIEGGLSVLMFVGTFAALRIAKTPRVLAAFAMTVGVLVLVYGLEYPLGGLLQHGAFRFGPPVGVVVGLVAASRWPERARPFKALAWATLGVSSIWSLEAVLYTSVTMFGMTLFELALVDRAKRRARGQRAIRNAVVAVAVAHASLALATVATKGTLPRWGWYATTLREFLSGDIGDLTYDFSSFSPALPLVCFYIVSVVAIAGFTLRDRDLVLRLRTLFLAIVGMTAWGIALFSYLVNRGADHIIPYTSLPAVALAALWMTLFLHDATDVSLRGRRVALFAILGLSTWMVAAEWSEIKLRAPQSALAYVVPGGPSLQTGIDRFMSPPPFNSLAGPAEGLLETWMPDEDRSIVITDADLSVEILFRSGRASAVPLGDPYEDSFVPEGHIEPLEEFIESLTVGDQLLIDAAGRESYDVFSANPDTDPFNFPVTGPGSLIPRGLATLQHWVVREVAERFDLEVLEARDNGLEVVRLTAREVGGAE